MANPFDQFDAPQAGPFYGPAPVVDPLKQAAEQRAVEDQQFQRERFAWDKEKFAKEQSQGGAKANQIPPAAAAGIQANLESLRALDVAISGLKNRPGSIGPGTGALGDTFTQFNDPEGTDVRSGVGKIGALTIHDLSGAAVSASEAPRFTPFVPSITDRPEVAQKKLEQFRRALESQIKESLDYYGPNNGYKPYQTPQAQEFMQGGFGLKQDDSVKRLTPEQEAAYNALVQSGASPDQIRAFGKQIGFSFDNADAVTKARDEGAGFVGAGSGQYNRPQDVQAAIDARPDGGVVAAANGATDAASLGFVDELSAGGDALAGSLGGQGSFGDLYDRNLMVERGFQDKLRSSDPIPYFGGQLVGGLALPAGGATSPGRLAALGAAYGGAYGVGSGTDAQSRLSGGILGATTGAAIGGGAGKLSQLIQTKARPQIPDLVDVSGRLNEPLEAAGPAGRVQAAQDFGIDLPMGSAGDRTASLIEKGLDNLPGSAGVMNDSRRVVEGQVQGAVDNLAGKFGSSRTLNEGGAELQRGAAERIDRGKEVIKKAYQAIPISDQAPAATNNTVGTLQSLTGRFQSNPELAASLKDPKLASYLDAIQGKGLNWRDLKDFRTLIGEKIGDMRFGESSSTSDLRALYAGLSEDMRATAASQGPGAVKAFERANSLNRNNEEVIQGALTRILGKDGQMAPEKAAMAVQAMTKGGKATGDLKTLRQIRAATVKSGAWDEIAGTLIRLGGQPANSEGRAFNPQTFVQWYSDMSEQARSMLFKPELRGELDKFVSVNQRLANSNALRNTSQSAPGIMAAGTVATAGAGIYSPMIAAKLLALGASNFGMAKVWTNPGFVKWATGFSRAAATGNQNAVRSQIGRLPKLATTNPSIRDALVHIQRELLNDNLPRAGSAAASPDQGPEQQQ